jgi:two-component system chemotaxis response regulator CheB
VPKPIRVLIVDDSAIVRETLSERLSAEPDIEVVGTAPDPFIARDKVVMLHPDVLTLDIEMPKMDGLTFLDKLMSYYPIPVIIVSSVTTKDPFAAVKALEIGAVDVVNKPGGSITVGEVAAEVSRKIRAAFELRESFFERRKAIEEKLQYRQTEKKKPSVPSRISGSVLAQLSTTDRVIAIGASTGGTVALEYILSKLPASMPPILVVQHMPPGFTRQFAERLNGLSSLTVREAEDGEMLEAGTALIAKGGFHLTLERRGATFYTKFLDTERIQYQKPAVDVLFRSVAEQAGRSALGVILTGMGKDGADGLLKMKNAGAWTIAQDEASSVVWGMPRVAVELDAHCETASLEAIPERIVALTREAMMTRAV